MIFTKGGLFRLLITIGVSFTICMLAMLVLNDGNVDRIYIINSILLGSLIWFVSENVMNFTSKVWPHNILPSYIALFILIAAGTSIGLYLSGFKSLKLYLIIVGFAELSGFIIAIVTINYYKKQLNTKLEEYKKKLD